MHKRYASILSACLAVCALSGCGDGESALVGVQCVPPQTKCEDGVQKICAITTWQEVPCPNGCDAKGEACLVPEDAECVVDVCDQGSQNILKRCVGNKYVPETCPDDKPICSGMACIADACTPSAKKCSADKKTVLACDSNKSWIIDDTCAEGKVCDIQKLECVDESSASVCTNDTIKCVSEGAATYYVCKDGQWGAEAKTCDGEKVCSGADGAAECKEKTSAADCTAGEKACVGEKIKTCGADGAWGPVSDCEEAGYVCDVNTKTCVPSSQAPECETGKLICGSDSDSPMTYKECVGGKIGAETKTCAADKPICSADGCKPMGTDCTPGQKVCSGDRIKTCKYDGTWGDAANCDATGYVCDVNKNACVPSAEQSECVNGTKKCVDVGALTVLPKSYHTCVDGKWSESTAACSGGGNCSGAAGSAECAGGAVIADCTLGAIQCVDAGTSKSYRTCIQLKEGTAWSNETQDCATSCQTNNGQSACADCTQGQTKCGDASGIRTCTSIGTWGTATACPDSTPICADKEANAAECVQCKTDDTRCASNGGQTNAIVQKCNLDNEWGVYSNCNASNKTCDPQTLTCIPKCTDGQARCNADGSFDYCSKGTWETLAQCGAQENCVATADNSNGYTVGCKCSEDSTECDAENSAVLTCKKTQIKDPASGSNAPKHYLSREVSETCAKKGLCSHENAADAAYCKCPNEHEFKCDGNELKVCLTGIWKSQLKCSDEETCNADLGSCNSQCYGSMDKGNAFSDTTAQCSGNNVISCVSDGSNVNASGMYEIKETCPSNKYCSGELRACTEPVVSGAIMGVYRCASDLKSVEKYEKAPASLKGEWKTEKTCKTNQICMMKKEGFSPTLKASCETKICDELAVGCQNDTTIGMCVNNAWTTVGVCGENGKCQDGKCVSTIK